MIDITGLVIAGNEAPNIARTLSKLTWLPEVVVIESNSVDGTRDIAASFPNVRVVTRAFTAQADQWDFALNHTGLHREWVLALDADYVLTDQLISEIKGLEPDPQLAGYWAWFKYCVGGVPLRSGAYPPVAVLYRRAGASYRQDGHAQRVQLDGPLGRLSAPVLHDDRKSLTHWLGSQARYMALEAEKLSEPGVQLGFTDRLRRTLVLAPPTVFLYCYVIKGGMLEGRAGLFYALQRTVAETILSLYLLKKKLGLA